MPESIKLLPEHVANQIAAGEVILRPASVVKELLENAIDAGGKNIRILIKDAGKALIQVIDDGSGMSPDDARMCFERHATSKLRTADDLFAIKTMGFRGEALASIAAVAQVELKTRRSSDELGNLILIEGSKVKTQESTACPTGTSVSVKNLFFNVPARRNFLKSDTMETNQMMEEFFRVALVHPETAFSFFLNGKETYHLIPGNLRQRILQIFGNHMNEKLVPVEQDTVVVNIRGFAGKPQHARKTRGEQYFFVNGRFIRHPYFHHAVDTAYRQLIPEKHFPAYFIFFELDPADLDVNIHPTKTEVKFLNEKAIYAILLASVRQSLGKFSLTPSLDFDLENSLDPVSRDPNRPIVPPKITINPDYNPFQTQKPSDPLRTRPYPGSSQPWEKVLNTEGEQLRTASAQAETGEIPSREEEARELFQLKNRYIIAAVRSGMLIVDQERAHERILFERFLELQQKQEVVSQQELFPSTCVFPLPDAKLLKELLPDLRQMGFVIEEALHHENSFVVSGIPTGMEESMLQQSLEEIVDSFKTIGSGLQWDKATRMAASLARNLGIRNNKPLQAAEMNKLINDLFSCKIPELTPDGKKTLVIITTDEIENRFKQTARQ
ncbi:MAG TPA: DNA mismatch repair endonuclease MutL [Bacteroidales bacterium]|nr:DNA mismatch repair endonuclease MutL [Bacteroidales bacterium]HSA44437.1 DNA mismatch repair endonuclease MutL [Bacteroidales bacterium]